MNYFLKNILWLFIGTASLNVSAQEKLADSLKGVHLKILPSDSLRKFPDNFRQKYIYKDSVEVSIKLVNLIDSLRQVGFLTASIDSLIQQDSIYTVFLFLGKTYQHFQIENGNIPEVALKRIGRTPLISQPLFYEQLKVLKERLLDYAENNGYPFASIRLKEVHIMDEIVFGKLFWDKGKVFRLGNLKAEGEGKLNTAYLENYLGLKAGNLYQKEKIIASSQKIQALPFIVESRPPVVQFQGNEATVNLFLDPKKANRFDFLIGVLPNNQETGKVLITGNIDAEFQNQFGKGEYLHFEFEQLRPETQQLTIETNFPYLLNTPLGIDFEFGLYKRDSTYRDLIWNFGLQYLFDGGNYLKAFSKNTTSTLLAIDQQAIIRNRQLPAILDVKNTAFGLAYQLEKLDYRFNPREGWLLQLEGSAGFKEIIKNNKITSLQDDRNPTFSFATLYSPLDLSTFQYQLIGRVDKYFPIRKRGVLKSSIRGATILSEAPVLKNEQFRLGGNQLLRGFDEESIFATSYLLGTIEYRYLIGANSYFFLFGDVAYLENRTTENDFSNRPLGIGAGMTFETKAGIFGISYALGKLAGAAFEFRAAKVHFGFVSLF